MRRDFNRPSGMTGKETDMTTATQARPAAATLPAVLGAFALGLVIVLLAGFAQADALHAAAHDTRHAAGFPCH